MSTPINKSIDSLTEATQARVRAWLELCLGRVPVYIIEAYRSPERQKELYAKGRTTPGPIVTDTLQSNHMSREAIDFGFMENGKFHYNGDWNLAYDLGEQVGLISLYRQGAKWDRAHLEFNHNFKDMKEQVPDWKGVVPAQKELSAQEVWKQAKEAKVFSQESGFNDTLSKGELAIVLKRLNLY